MVFTLNVVEASKRSIIQAISPPANARSVAVWKILIYDKRGEEIIAPVIEMATLRRYGVTLALSLSQARDPVKDGTVYYVCESTYENLDKIVQDINDSKYLSYNLNFIYSISVQKLQYLSSKIKVNKVQKVLDLFQKFVSISANTFSLNLMNSLQTLYSPPTQSAVPTAATGPTKTAGQATTGQGSKPIPFVDYPDPRDRITAINPLELHLQNITEGLISVIRTLNIRPIIKFPKDQSSPAKAVARQLISRLKELENGSEDSWHTTLKHQKRPVLILLDRTIDLFVMVSHSMMYQALAHDIFDVTLNKVTIQSKTYFIGDTDEFWASHKHNDIADVIPAVASAAGTLNAPGQDTAKVSTFEDQGQAQIREMMDTLKNIPDRKRKKGLIASNFEIANALFQEGVQKRVVKDFCEVEEQLLQSLNPNMNDESYPKSVEELLKKTDSAANNESTAFDRRRLLICLALTRPKMGKATVENLCRRALGQPMTRSIEFVRSLERIRGLRPGEMKQIASHPQLVSHAISFGQQLLSRVAGTGQRQLPIVRTVDDILNSRGKSSEEFEEADPLGLPMDLVPPPHLNSTIVFVVGGGSFQEQAAFDRYSTDTDREIIYGSTSFPRPETFVQELEVIGGL